jgi:hypothetical protein
VDDLREGRRYCKLKKEAISSHSLEISLGEGTEISYFIFKIARNLLRRKG